ncbi:MAG: MFS transporter [Alphaproteobacteria bacterium]|nr:MFS transporter [Alphaproteobacteria bacterium]
MRYKTLLSSLVGNALEYYDFTIFAVFSVEIGRTFFSTEDDNLKTLLPLAVFAVGFFMRPLGAVFFGHIGDKMGRKKALTLSIACMAIPTLAIGFMPGHEALGVVAPFLLIMCRLIQGLSIGGEGAGSAIFILEHNHKLNAGYLGGIITSSNFIGAFFATLVGLGMSSFFPESISWRYAFIFGGALGFVGVYLRTRIPETPIFETLLRENKVLKFPLIKVFSENKEQIFLSISLGGIAGAFAYMILAFMNLFFQKTVGLSPTLSLAYASCGIGGFIVSLPLFGILSDRIGYKSSLLHACYGVLVLSVPLFLLMSVSEGSLNLLGLLMFAALAAWVCSPAYPIMIQIFPPQQRYSGIAFGFNIGLALFGGTAPMISAYLTQATNLSYSPAFYLMGVSLFYIGVSSYTAYRQRELQTSFR